ncbi:MAG: NAAT family transporter [Epsilonproteobacteria bacterium]|nr:NAAT family transporter [Campylobacterota bacterium]
MREILFDTISLITILNPIAAAAIMLSLVRYSDIPEVSKKASLAVFVGSVITVLTGGLLLKFFGINIPSIKAIGGVILLIIALHLIQGQNISPTNSTQAEHDAATKKDDVAIIPLAIPILFGPGMITTLIVLSEKHEGLIHKGILIVAVALASVVVYLALRYANLISKFLGVNGLKIVTRIMGLIIGAISFLFLVGGIKELWLNL